MQNILMTVFLWKWEVSGDFTDIRFWIFVALFLLSFFGLWYADKRSKQKKIRMQLAELKVNESGFSYPDFLNFANELINAFYKSFGTQKLLKLRPFLSDYVIDYKGITPERYAKFKIRKISLLNVVTDEKFVEIQLNARLYLWINQTKKIVVERFYFRHNRKVPFKKFNKKTALLCPYCETGSTYYEMVCAQCRKKLILGEAEWYVEYRYV